MLLQTTSECNINYDWSEYNPAMMKTPISPALCQNFLPTSQPQPSTSPLLVIKKQKTSSRRRPILATSTSETLLEAKVDSLKSVKIDAREEHKLQMQILQLQKQQEEEKLKQEKMKTELLKLQLQRETGVKWVFEDDNDDNK